MKILDIKATSGPSYWSATRHQLIVMTLDIAEWEERPTDTIPGFSHVLEETFPGMYSHTCSIGKPGGFFERVRRGTWGGHVIEHVALELQALAGIDVHFGQTRGTGTPGTYFVVFGYESEDAGRYAARAAVKAVKAMFTGCEYNPQKDVQEISRLQSRSKFGPTTQAIVDAAKDRGIPVIRIMGDSLLQLGYGSKQKRISAAMTSNTSAIAMELAGDKDETKYLLDEFDIPVPKGVIVQNKHHLQEALTELSYPVVIKPLDGNHGKGVSTNISDWKMAIRAFLHARKYSQNVMVEQYIPGSDHRLLVINYNLEAASLRTPAFITGNGKSTVKDLIRGVNDDPRRGEGHSNVLTCIRVDDITRRILKRENLSLDSVLPFGKVLFLKDTANLSTGGTAEDVTDIVHPSIRLLASQVASIIGLDICGIDLVTTDISRPLSETGGAVIEVNAAPGFRMHTHPTKGRPRNVGKAVMDMMFPEGNTFSIPIVAVTGTNGKTTTTRLIAHMATLAGFKTGYTNTEGICVNERVIEKGDCSGPGSAEKILKNPSVDFAVLECARGGILRSGLGFKFCHVGVVTNVTEDHLGLGGIDSIEKLARVKSVVPESVLPEGYAVLNAEDKLVFGMKEDLDCKIALFSLDPTNSNLIQHKKNGGLCATVEKGSIVIYKGGSRIEYESLANIPITHNGKASFNVQNALAAILAALTSGLDADIINKALRSFNPSPDHSPGRLNLFKLDNFEIILDYGHNPGALKAMGEFISHFPNKPKIGVITGVGDRRDEDIINLATIAAEKFDQIWLRVDKDLRGRKDTEIEKLLIRGIHSVKPYMEIPNIGTEKEAIEYIFKHAPKGSLIVYFSEKTDYALAYFEDQIKQVKNTSNLKMLDHHF
jgi:cyanophycin synthetase